jgi:hypothetical protein
VFSIMGNFVVLHRSVYNVLVEVEQCTVFNDSFVASPSQ